LIDKRFPPGQNSPLIPVQIKEKWCGHTRICSLVQSFLYT